jgi:hypothetical protein
MTSASSQSRGEIAALLLDDELDQGAAVEANDRHGASAAVHGRDRGPAHTDEAVQGHRPIARPSIGDAAFRHQDLVSGSCWTSSCPNDVTP